MEDTPRKLLQWHAAFYAGIQIELEEEAENLLFENEHMLSTKPMQVDVLITKKDAGKGIQKNIGKIFRKYNLIEYKSPKDYVSINDFHKVLGYAHFYVADTIYVNEIKREELSISFVCHKYPQKLINYLTSDGYTVERQEEGIFYIKDGPFAMQILVCSKLSEESNLWLKNLTDEITDTASVEKLALAYDRNKENKLYSSVMDILIRANVAKFNEVKNMCEALKELYKEELEERYSQGIINTLLQLVRDGLLALSIAAERAQMSVEEFQKRL